MNWIVLVFALAIWLFFEHEASGRESGPGLCAGSRREMKAFSFPQAEIWRAATAWCAEMDEGGPVRFRWAYGGWLTAGNKKASQQG
ncbi:hypothetical protein [Aeromonas veronii]|uniref:hypothetical protein n=1 Tax=Aeromonas veronii TaxID=654 RepID=UPI0032EF3B4D